MRKIKLNQLLIQFLTLIPKLAGLQILWFIVSLPLFTVFSATRTLTERLSYMGKQVEEEPTSFSLIFGKMYRNIGKKMSY